MNAKLFVTAAAAAAGLSAANAAPAAERAPIFGICEHVACPGWDHDNCDRDLDAVKAAGIGWVRTDFPWNVCEPKDGVWDWTVFDRTVAEAERRGITLLPILCYDNPARGRFAWQEPDAWCEYVRRVVARYRRHFKVVEVWNEPNIGFWKPKPDADQYLGLLRRTYETVKRTAPEIRVAIGGTAGVPLDFFEKIYAAGGRPFFDIMNIHPYSWPEGPDARMKSEVDGLRALMARHGDAGKPVWITEQGWPTHKVRFGEEYALRAGLRLARPEMKTWRAAFARCRPDDATAPGCAEAIAALLGEGSTAKVMDSAELRAALASGAVDLVVYPCNEDFPYDTVDAVRDFVAKGGVLVDFGGYPMFYPYVDGTFVGSARQGAREGEEARRKFRVGVDAWWMNKDIPETAKCFVTERAAAAGYRADPAGFEAGRFFNARLLRPGDEMIPLLVGRDKTGADAVAACVYRFGSDMKGAVIVSSRGFTQGTSTEAQQAAHLRRMLEIAEELGIEAVFPYELRAWETDPYYSEHHFGILHRDLSPKPAYDAYRRFIAERR